MAFIYKITNKVNQKSYIGKTMKTIQERWNYHIVDSKRERCSDRPLYKAMNKYGINNFVIEEVEQCSDIIVNEREQYWIQYFDTYNNGYNATLGGDGSHYLDYDYIVETYLSGHTKEETANICNCNVDSVTTILKERNIPIKSSTYWMQKNYSKAIQQFSLNGELLNEFFGVREAARYLQQQNLTKAKDEGGIATNIRRVANNKGRSYLGFYWKWK